MRQKAGSKLERSPLQLVLVQVRFSPVAAMREYVPNFQDQLRKAGFPGFDKEQIQQVTFGPEPTTETTTRWVFSSRDKKEAVVLTDDFVVYEVSNYGLFESFTTRFLDILTKLNSAASISFASQIGLRYVDVVHSLDGHHPDWFLREQFHGLSSEEVGEIVTNQFLSVVKTQAGVLKLKTLDGRGPGFMPRDLESSHLVFDLTLQENEPFRILDFDHIWKGEVDLRPEEIISTMWKLHGSIEEIFKATVTDEALSVWGSVGDGQ